MMKGVHVHFVFGREVGTIIRSLGCCPTEAELTDMLVEVGIELCFKQRHTSISMY